MQTKPLIKITSTKTWLRGIIVKHGRSYTKYFVIIEYAFITWYFMFTTYIPDFNQINYIVFLLTWFVNSSRRRLISSSLAASCALWLDLWSSISWAISAIFWFKARFAPSRSETLLIRASILLRDSFSSWTEPAVDPLSCVSWDWRSLICKLISFDVRMTNIIF